MDLDHFYRFCSVLHIDSKEMGKVPLMDSFYGTQRYLMEEIKKGLEEDVHDFIVLKGRQQGISTVMLALDLYWAFRHKALQGSIVVDSEGNREKFRAILTGYLDSLPRTMKVPVKTDNRIMLMFENRSNFIHQIANTRSRGSLGKGKGLNFLHATECSVWSDLEGLQSLTASLAQSHPDRLYVYESTAMGFNMFYDMWEQAKDSVTRRAIFIGWWRKQEYSIARDDWRFVHFWDGSPTGEETEWMEEVKALYGVDILPEQLAWWRWQEAEEFMSLNMLYQEHPPTPDYAFQATGSRFFPAGRLTETWKAALDAEFIPYRYAFGDYIDESSLVGSNDLFAELRIWDEPVKGGVYVLGADPSGGHSENSDRFSVQVLRCYADRVVQVAEYASVQCSMVKFAWVIFHLAGYYGDCMINLEINGPGIGTWQEMQRIQSRGWGMRTVGDGESIRNFLRHVRYYIWSRPDIVGGGSGHAWHFKTDRQNKQTILHRFRDAFERKYLDVRSVGLLDEMRYISQDGDHISGEGRHRDDRVMAMALAIECWFTKRMSALQSADRTWKAEQDMKGELPDFCRIEVDRFFRGLGYKRT